MESLKKANLVNRNTPVKLLANGKISKKVTIKVNKASKTAIAAIEEVGGTVELV